MARAVRRTAPGVPVFGIDICDEATSLASRDGVRPMRRLAECPLDGAAVVFAAPLDATVALMEEEPRAWTAAWLATDAASLKAPVMAAAKRAGESGRVFAGAHPMCGSERSGYAAGRADLFDGARVWLCGSGGSGGGSDGSGVGEDPALRRAAAFWRSLGGCPRAVSAERHDQVMCWASHLPQLAAWALAGALEGAGIGPGELGPGGRDMTRLAASAPEMWLPLLGASAAEDARAVRALESQLRLLRSQLEDRDLDALREAALAGRRWSSATS